MEEPGNQRALTSRLAAPPPRRHLALRHPAAQRAAPCSTVGARADASRPWLLPRVGRSLWTLAAVVAAAYVMLMAARVVSMAAATYVRDIGASRAFYERPGFGEHPAGKAEAPAWPVMQHGGVSVLLVAASPALDIPPLPLLSCFFCEDLDAVFGALEGAGVPVTRTGHPRTRPAAR